MGFESNHPRLVACAGAIVTYVYMELGAKRRPTGTKQCHLNLTVKEQAVRGTPYILPV
jgi:hypothetical protein